MRKRQIFPPLTASFQESRRCSCETARPVLSADPNPVRLSTASPGGEKTRSTGEFCYFAGVAAAGRIHRGLPAQLTSVMPDICSIWAKPFDKDLRRHIVKYFPSSYHGFDKKGQPVYIDRTGSAEIDKVLEVRVLQLRSLPARCARQQAAPVASAWA